MKSNHQHADNLFVRLSAAKPHPKHTPLENFCTEGLAWCLRHSAPFKMSFTTLCEERLRQKLPLTVPEISTQVKPVPKNGNAVAVLKKSQFDLELCFSGSPSVRLILEVKVDSDVQTRQLEIYLSHLGGIRSTADRLLLLVSVAKKIPEDAKYVPRIYWEDVYRLLQSNAPKDAIAAEGWILQQFAAFLHNQGFSPLNMKPLSSSKLAASPDVVRFIDCFQHLLKKLKQSGELKAPYKEPGFEFDDSKESVTWYGLHLSESSFSEGWVGLTFLHKTSRVELMFEGVFPGKLDSTKTKKLKGKSKLKDEDGQTRVWTTLPLTQQLTGSEGDLMRWITATAAAMREIGKSAKQPRTRTAR